MKYILLLLISFSALADDNHEAELKAALDQNDKLLSELTKANDLTVNYKQYLENITDMCLGGNNFVSLGSDGSIYRFSCDLVEVVK